MKTLVIHPYDSTTQFLCDIYKNKNWTIINHYGNQDNLKQAIQQHDRIIMLGHGTPYGLLSSGRRPSIYTIDSSFVYLLKQKKDNLVAIWCNADIFMDKYNLEGFFTGMIISEMYEAKYLNIQCTEKDIEESNLLFAKSIKQNIDNISVFSMWENVLKEYLSETNPIIQYNRENIYCE